MIEIATMVGMCRGEDFTGSSPDQCAEYATGAQRRPQNAETAHANSNTQTKPAAEANMDNLARHPEKRWHTFMMYRLREAAQSGKGGVGVDRVEGSA
jgi:hypothetical protein